MKTNVKLIDLLNITNPNEFKIHFATPCKGTNPLNLFYNDYSEWIKWNEFKGKRNDFNRKYIICLIRDYSLKDSYIYAGIFEVIGREKNKYNIEEIDDTNDYKGNIVVHFKRPRGHLGRSKCLETYKENLIVTEILPQSEKINDVIQTDILPPNIFKYATSELSQDAFLLWFLQWANPTFASSDKNLNKCACNFIYAILSQAPFEIKNVKVYKQWNNIDVFAVINEKFSIIIEDKTNTSEHSNQLIRYFGYISTNPNFKNSILYCIYYKTGNESTRRINEIRETFIKQTHSDRFKVLERKDMINILKEYKGNNVFLTDYYYHINAIEEKTNSFQTLPIDKWEWRTWEGFYKKIEQIKMKESIKDKNLGWGTINSPSGAFVGLWWHWCKDSLHDKSYLYLQIEGGGKQTGRLCIKLDMSMSSADYREVRNYWTKRVEDKNAIFKRPIRRGIGKWMTIAYVELIDILMANCLINMIDFANKLKEQEKFLDNLICSQ